MSIRLLRATQTVSSWQLALVLGITVWIGSPTAPQAQGQTIPPPGPAPISLDQLFHMCPAQLDAIYHQGIAAAIPDGCIRGTPILSPGTKWSPIVSHGARVCWQGKVFENCQNTAVNRFFGVKVVRGLVYGGPSWLDGQPSLVLDYEQTSCVYADYRDEIRQIAPCLYLGLMYDRTTCPPSVKMYFALEAQH
jgi:hypothetical protein